MLLVLATLFFSKSVFAYPEMARHGYVNCATCHFSRNGNGLLNEYGHELSKETAAVWTNPDEKSKENHAVYGLLDESPITKWLTIGGDARAVYTYQNDQFAEQGQLSSMQAELQLAAVLSKQWTIVASIGPTNYVNFKPDDHWGFRVGNFIPDYGINTAEHVSLTRSTLNLGPNLETINAEAALDINDWKFSTTAIIMTPTSSKKSKNNNDPNSGKNGTPFSNGVGVQAEKNLSENVDVGVNALYGKVAGLEETLIGYHGIYGFAERWAIQSEFDLRNYKGGVIANKLSYEIVTGLWTALKQEWYRSDFNDQLTETKFWGTEIRFFPRTHFDFMFQFELKKTPSFSADYYDVAWLVGHFYL